ncbi:MAG: hypothetical protein Q4E21_05750 [Clostridia bacterium]|nr:hypothetical protein [Clostridia bacterium]
MRKITWILPVVSICLALFFSVGAVCAFSPVLVNVLTCDIENNPETENIAYTWHQSEAAHDLLLWQAKHAVSPTYRAACLQYLTVAYYHPKSDWSAAHAETGAAVYDAYVSQYADALYSYGFLTPTYVGAEYGGFYDIDMKHAAYVYFQIDKTRGKEMYLDYVKHTEDHFYCDEFLRAVLQDDNADTEDIAWAKAQAGLAAETLSAEYRFLVDLQEETQEDKAMPHTNAQYETKCETLRNLASDTN